LVKFSTYAYTHKATPSSESKCLKASYQLPVPTFISPSPTHLWERQLHLSPFSLSSLAGPRNLSPFITWIQPFKITV